MSIYICIKHLSEDYNVSNPCKCWRCVEEREHQEAIDYYKLSVPEEPLHCDVFPEKINKE